MKLLGLVVLFNPDRDVWDNIRTYIDGVDELILWLNSPIEPIPVLSSKQIIMGDGENVGIGKALNEAVLYAVNNNFTHLLTMDQDSSFDDIFAYKDAIRAYSKDDVGCFCPYLNCENVQEHIKNEEKYREVKDTITSGSIYPVSIFDKIGLFREDFFIDAIDIEFCNRIRLFGFKVLKIADVFLNHKLGNKRTFKWFIFRFQNINYPPIRIYYILRNHIITNKMYPVFSDSFGFYQYFVFRRFCQILLYEPNKGKKLKAMFYGLLHGWKGKTGVCTIF